LEDLKNYIDKAKTVAEAEDAPYNEDTLRFVTAMFGWNHPERSTFHKEAACIVLIRKNPVKGEPPKQTWVRTYRYTPEKEQQYSDNFVYIARLLKALSDLQRHGEFNIFMTYSTFYYQGGIRRIAKQSYRSNAVGIDLDFNKLKEFQGLTFEQSINKIKADNKELFKKYHPMIVQSGGGCQLYFLLSKPLVYDAGHDATDQMNRHKFKYLAKRLAEMLERVGSDPKCTGDLARIFRVPGTCSLKYEEPRPVRLFEAGAKYGFQTILRQSVYAFEAKPVRRPRQQSPKPDKATKPRSEARAATDGKCSDICPQIPMDTVQARWFDLKEFNGTAVQKRIVQRRMDDLVTAIGMMKGDIEGFRNTTLFVTAATLAMGYHTKEELLPRVLSVNNLFLDPISVREVENVVVCILKRHQKVSNYYIGKNLFVPWGIDMTKLNGLYTIEDKRARCRSRYKKKKAFGYEEKLAYIREHPNKSTSELAADLMCCEQTIRNLRKKL